MASVRGWKKGKESGGTEGSGGGDGDGDGGKGPVKGVKGDGEKVFTFGKTHEGEKSAEGGPIRTTMAGSKNGAPSFSYRDKLLSPGGAGFLVQHSEDDDIMQGWKDYFHKMNEKDYQCEAEESENEDNLDARRMEGKPGKLNFTAEEYAAWCTPWMNSLIIKILGATFPTFVIRDRINRMWRPKDPLKLIPLSNGYFIVSFSNKEDRAYAFQEGPWMIEDHYLTVQRWRPNFNPSKADLQCNIAAWVRLPDVPFEFYNVESLRRIGNMIGKMIKVDRSTSIYDKGLHQVCFECGQYGHQKTVCPLKIPQPSMSTPEQGNEKSSGGDNEENKVVNDGEQGSKKASVGGAGGVNVETGVGGEEHPPGGEGVGKNGTSPPMISSGPAGGQPPVPGGKISDASPFGKIKILRRDFRGHFMMTDVKKETPGYPVLTVETGDTEFPKDTQQVRDKSESRIEVKENKQIGVKENKHISSKDKGPLKAEWIQVGMKRKSEGKGRLKGKENKPPGRPRGNRSPLLGQGVEPMKSNSFAVLQDMEAQMRNSTPMDKQNLINCEEGSQTVPQDVQDKIMADAIQLKPSVPQESLNVGGQVIKDMEHVQHVDVNMGTGAKSFPALVRELKNHYKLDFIAIVETMCSKEMSVARANQLGFPHMELVDCEGYSGGIWCLWDHSISAITILERHHQFIHLQISGEAGYSWQLTVVYASPSCVARRVL
ncbi:hypothetical protein K1719_007240 [Acacia pycnantha]|nr:hypothetical protein K1719_007240 [Acacia pycnantha]